MVARLPDDYWIEIPGGSYVVGLVPAEAKLLAQQSAAWFEHHGPEWSINDEKLLGRAVALTERQGKESWVEKYLLAHFPAREVQVAPFAIARYPVTNGLYRQFMAETGECVRPNGWGLEAPFSDDDRPTRGIAWAAAVAFAKWSGARLPFENEWERAVRGPERSLFPWGNTFAPLGWEILDDESPRLWTVDATTTPEGIRGALIGMGEWCADTWTEPANLDRSGWNEIVPSPGTRVVRGMHIEDKAVLSGVARSARRETDYESKQTGVRLVRSDGRSIPAMRSDVPVAERQHAAVREFEVHRVCPALNRLEQSKMASEHRIRIDHLPTYRGENGDQGVSNVMLAAARETQPVRFGPPETPDTHVHGMFVAAVSRESIRRHPSEHGAFVWNIQYRYAAWGEVRARSVAAYHMAFDKSIHRIVTGFRPGEADTKLEDLNEDLIERAILDAFWFYERFADGDRSPF